MVYQFSSPSLVFLFHFVLCFIVIISNLVSFCVSYFSRYNFFSSFLQFGIALTQFPGSYLMWRPSFWRISSEFPLIYTHFKRFVWRFFPIFSWLWGWTVFTIRCLGIQASDEYQDKREGESERKVVVCYQSSSWLFHWFNLNKYCTALLSYVITGNDFNTIRCFFLLLTFFSFIHHIDKRTYVT